MSGTEPVGVSEVRVDDVAVAAVDGTELTGRLHRPDGGAGPAATVGVLLTHGVHTDHRGSVVGWLGERLAARRWTALSLDRRDSGGVPLTVTVEDGVDDLAVGVDALVAAGCERVVVAGHSKGTTLAAAYAAWRPDRQVAGVALIATVADQHWVARDILLRDRCDELLADARARLAGGDDALYEVGGDGSGLRATPSAFLSGFGPDTIAAPVRSMARVRVPVLVVRCEGDELTPLTHHDAVVDAGVAAGVGLTERILVPDLPLEPAAAHRFVGLEDELADEMAAWLTTLARPRD